MSVPDATSRKSSTEQSKSVKNSLAGCIRFIIFIIKNEFEFEQVVSFSIWLPRTATT